MGDRAEHPHGREGAGAVAADDDQVGAAGRGDQVAGGVARETSASTVTCG